MRSFFFGLGLALLLVAGAVALRLHVRSAHGLPGCPITHAPGHPAPVPLTGGYFQTGIVDGQWGDGIPRERPLDLTVLRQGGDLYARDCRTCHGALGLGDGLMTRLPDGPRGVADLQTADAVARPDGELFAIVTRGKGKMIGYGDTISAADRWAIVAYLRALQASQHGAAADMAGGPSAVLSPPASETGLGAPTAAETERLSTYGWIDQKIGTVHIPLERALETTLHRLRAKQTSAPVPSGPITPLP
jgi:mono/diheme cytochrome c family protein